MKTFFKKLGYRFLVECTKIENTSFPYKTAISEANVKTNRMASTKWTYHNEWSFARNYFIFLKILFQFKNVLKRVDLMYQRSRYPYSYFSEAPGVSFEGAFSLLVSLNKLLSSYYKYLKTPKLYIQFTHFLWRTCLTSLIFLVVFNVCLYVFCHLYLVSYVLCRYGCGIY